jgi:hypothetical protein
MERAPVPVLAYARDASDERVVYERTEDGIRIKVYRPGRWWTAVGGWLFVALVLIFCLAPWRGGLAWLWWTVGLTLAVAATWEAVRRLGRPVVIELTMQRLSFRNLGGKEEGRDRDLPRDAVYEIKAVSHSGMLVVRARGHDMFEGRVSEELRQTEFVAALLREAMGWEGAPTGTPGASEP